ncbi:MAG: DUF302 domain-containing protein [Rhodocyclaceae bacterium]|nr:DUF302 domain-containing protein [Rhodocyclaceae bacterium]
MPERPTLTAGAPRALAAAGRVLVVLVALLGLPALAEDTRVIRVEPSRYPIARDALKFSIENAGLIVSSVSAFGQMLTRTAPDLGHRADLYRDAEVMAFCSARVAATLAAEARTNIALCPLTMTVYSLPDTPGAVFIAWRTLDGDSPGAKMGNALLESIGAEAAEAAELAPPPPPGPR